MIRSFSLRFVGLALVGWSIAAVVSAGAVDLPPGFGSDVLVEHLNAATAMTVAPDGRIFLADQTGWLRVWKRGRLLEPAALDLSDRVDDYWERGLIGVTLHPDFPKTPYLFVVYVAKAPFTHHVVSRFTMSGDAADPKSEWVLLEGDDQSKLGGSVPAGHQGGIIRVGPDGKVYVGLGEQTAGRPAQALDTLQGKILRLNPDGSIPRDNPFYGQTTGKYRAIWAFGIRNPFGLAFEPKTGRLFETEVGQSLFEEVNIIVKGGNYGWPEAEGMSANPAFINPIHAYPPTIGRSIVGGAFVPEDSSWPEKWRGKFLFGDWANHWIRGLDPKSAGDVTTLARNLNGPVALEFGPDGALYVLNRGTIWRDGKKFVAESGSLVRIRYEGAESAQELRAPEAEMPAKLSETGVVSSMQPFEPAKGFVPVEINCPPWQPGVRARRWMRIPEGRKIAFAATGEWKFPMGAVAIQHFEISEGSAAGRPFETQVLWFTGPREARAGAYRWNAQGTEAELVEDGDVVPLPGEPSRRWFSPGAERHLNLDSVVTGFLLPINTRQCNREVVDGEQGRMVNQLQRWSRRGFFEGPVEGAPETWPQLRPIEDNNASLTDRVRSYLDVNCSVCHRPGGLSRGQFDARFETPLAEQRIMSGELIAGDLGIAGAAVVVPGHPEKSIMYQRVSRNDGVRMPPVNVNEEPQPIVPLLEEWIRSMAAPAKAEARLN